MKPIFILLTFLLGLALAAPGVELVGRQATTTSSSRSSSSSRTSSTRSSSTRTSSTRTSSSSSRTSSTRSTTSSTRTSSSSSRTSTTKTTSYTPVGTPGSSTYANEGCTVGYCTLGSGTTGGAGGPVYVVTTLAELTAAVLTSTPKVIIISGTITGDAVVQVYSNTTILGRNAHLVGIGLRVSKGGTNIIIRNLTISKVLADTGDAIAFQGPTGASNAWIDHCDLSSDLAHDKDYYDGLLDLTHAADLITVSNTYFHDHWKTSLIGHSDSNAAEDTGHLRATYYQNRWERIDERTPSLRFGTGHVFNSFYDTIITSSINTRMGAQMLVEGNVWRNTTACILNLYSDQVGYAVARNNDYGIGNNSAAVGTLTSMPYAYATMATTAVEAYVKANAGAILNV